MTEPSARRELLNRYRRAWKSAWKHRKEMDPPKRGRDETQFLPEALALQDKPVHPAPRLIMWSIMIFVVLAIFWACFSKIDVVATSTGKIVPSGKSKVIQSSEIAVVKRIHVADGQVVKSGDILVELDPQSTQADVARLQNELTAAQIDNARAAALLEAIANNTTPTLGARIPNINAKEHESTARWLQGQYLELRSSLEQADAEIEKRKAEIVSTQTSISAIEKILPITKKLVSDYKTLAQEEYVPRHAYLEKQQTLMGQERELALLKARIHELSSSQTEAEKHKETLIAQTRRMMLDMEQTAGQKAASLMQELKKAEQRNQLMQIISPVDGIVQQLAIHTVNGVVTAAQPLMVIVPTNQPIEVEAMLENKDIGFVHVGQEVEIKVDTFTFTKYGIIHGIVTSVSHDAIEDERRGLLYSLRIALKENTVAVGNKRVPLSPGMSVRAEIKLEQRRVIDYFLSPLKQYVSESLNER